MSVVKYYWSTQSYKFALFTTSKEVKDIIYFLYADKHQSWHYHFQWKLPDISKVPKKESCNIFAISWKKSLATSSVFYCDAKQYI